MAEAAQMTVKSSGTAAQAAVQQAQQAQESDEAASRAYDSFILNSEKVKNSFSQIREVLSSTKQAAENADAEKAAAEQQQKNGAALSIQDALNLVDQERDTARAGRQNLLKTAKTAISNLGSLGASAAEVMLESAKDAGDGVKEAAGDGKSAMSIGLAAGFLIDPSSSLGQSVNQAIKEFTGLENTNETETEVKYVGDVETAEDQGNYMTVHGNGETQSAYETANISSPGEPVTEAREVAESGRTEVETDEATEVTEETLDRFGNIDEMDSWMDKVAEKLSALDRAMDADHDGEGLVSKVAEAVAGADIGGSGAGAVAKEVSSRVMDRLREETGKIDRNESEKSAEKDDGPIRYHYN